MPRELTRTCWRSTRHWTSWRPRHEAAELVKLRYFAGLTDRAGRRRAGYFRAGRPIVSGRCSSLAAQALQTGIRSPVLFLRQFISISLAERPRRSRIGNLRCRNASTGRNQYHAERDHFRRAVEIAARTTRSAYPGRACAGNAGCAEPSRRCSSPWARGELSWSGPATSVAANADVTATAEEPGTIIGPLQAAGADRRRRHGRSSTWPSKSSRCGARWRSRSSSRAWTTKQVVARFEAERQALALMDHPNIAKVLDAGTTDAGRPYFVMELVRGHRRSPTTAIRPGSRSAQRLELFVQVCQAVQHAHQKGIIHRDLKPSNILVDARTTACRCPKVIDFGVAKATGPAADRADRCYTGFAQMIGTPLYMSPEQAELNRARTSTRAATSTRWACCSTNCSPARTPFDQETPADRRLSTKSAASSARRSRRGPAPA